MFYSVKGHGRQFPDVSPNRGLVVSIGRGNLAIEMTTTRTGDGLAMTDAGAGATMPEQGRALTGIDCLL